MARAVCPFCGVKTVHWHPRLREEQRTCDACYATADMTRWDLYYPTQKTVMRHLRGKNRITVTIATTSNPGGYNG